MARITGTDILLQECMKEQFIKEESAALAFFMKNVDKFTAKSGVSEVFRKKLDAMNIDNARCRKLVHEAEERARKKREEEFNKKMKQLEEITPETCIKALDMRPASPKTLALLYEGTSHEGHGRKEYLEARYEKNPEDKFPLPITSSWDYGWRLSDSIKKDAIRKAPHGRVAIVNSTFYNRTGISFGGEAESKLWYC